MALRRVVPDGSATPMRGKSATCRKVPIKNLSVYDQEDVVGDQDEKKTLPASLRLAAHRRGRATGSKLLD